LKIIAETGRLILREMAPEDLPAIREIVRDEKTMYAWNGAWSEEETVEGLRHTHAAAQETAGKYL
jgi:RimJ/RimL family protein N-acetyltransferase